MLIICPSCATAYQIDVSSLGASGRQVRCARCRTVWLATAESAVAALETAAAGTDGARGAASAAGAADGKSDDADLGAWAAGGEHDDPTNRGSAAPTIDDAPSVVPPQNAGSPDDSAFPDDGKTIAHVGEDIETIAARRARGTRPAGRRGHFGMSRPGLPMIILIMIAMVAALIAWRGAVVRTLPQTATLFAGIGLPVNLRGLAFENLKTAHEFQDGVTVLVVEGTIVNVTRATVEVPRLRFGLRNGMGQEIYAWTALPGRSTLGPAEQLAFRTRLASPPSDGRDVVVRSFTRRDLAAGLH